MSVPIPRISLKSSIDKSKTSQSITNQITINTNSDVEAKYVQPVERSAVEDNQQVYYPYENIQQYDQVQVVGSELDELIKQNKELKAKNKASEIIIKMMKENPIYVSNLIITDDEQLVSLVKILTDAKEVTIDSEILFSGCCSAYEYKKVNAIYVIHEGQEAKNLKYDFPSVVKKLSELGINTKFVF